MVLLVDLTHHLPMAFDEPLHAIPFAQQLIPVHGIEVQSIALALHPILGTSAAEIPGIVVERQAVDSAQSP